MSVSRSTSRRVLQATPTRLQKQPKASSKGNADLSGTGARASTSYNRFNVLLDVPEDIDSLEETQGLPYTAVTADKASTPPSARNRIALPAVSLSADENSNTVTIDSAEKQAPEDEQPFWLQCLDTAQALSAGVLDDSPDEDNQAKQGDPIWLQMMGSGQMPTLDDDSNDGDLATSVATAEPPAQVHLVAPPLSQLRHHIELILPCLHSSIPSPVL